MIYSSLSYFKWIKAFGKWEEDRVFLQQILYNKLPKCTALLLSVHCGFKLLQQLVNHLKMFYEKYHSQGDKKFGMT